MPVSKHDWVGRSLLLVVGIKNRVKRIGINLFVYLAFIQLF